MRGRAIRRGGVKLADLLDNDCRFAEASALRRDPSSDPASCVHLPPQGGGGGRPHTCSTATTPGTAFSAPATGPVTA